MSGHYQTRNGVTFQVWVNDSDLHKIRLILFIWWGKGGGAVGGGSENTLVIQGIHEVYLDIPSLILIT